MGRLNGKRALITGAGAGIGRAIAAAFAGEGAEVLATDRNSATLAGFESHHGIETASLDVSDSSAVLAMAARHGRVDALVNCAGIVHHGTVLDASEAEWDRLFDVNVKSMHRTIAAFLPAMLTAGGGSIVNVASTVSSVRGVPNRYVYGATKAAVIGLTKAVAADFIRQNIRCNAICPGTVESPSLDGRIAAQAEQEGRSATEIREAFVARQPMGRIGTPDEIAWLAVYLASDESRYMTGQALVVDGGFTL